MLAGVILGGAYLYKYFALQVSGKMLRTFLPFFHAVRKLAQICSKPAFFVCGLWPGWWSYFKVVFKNVNDW